MQPGVLGTFPLLSSFNYGPIMKAARSAATHHTLRGRRREIPPSISSSHHILLPLHQPPLCHVAPSRWPVHSHRCLSFNLYLFFSERILFLFASSLFHLTYCFFFDLSLCLYFVFQSSLMKGVFSSFSFSCVSFFLSNCPHFRLR